MNYNKFSNYFGLVAHYKFPKTIQNLINSWYIKKFDINMEEFKSADKYNSLNALFTRTLNRQRELEDGFISPSDGTCLECKKGDKQTAYSIKNYSYSVNELLGKSLKAGELESQFEYINIYLSPKDYHHYHSPCDLEIMSLHYIPGKLFSVAKSWLEKVDNLYCKNERVILKAKLNNGKQIWLVFIGAWNVGKMKFDFEPRIDTNIKAKALSYEYSNLNLKKGDHIGNFELGSTIVMISEKNGIEYNVKADDTLKFGKNIGKIL
ncbi:phosphatidylserine decarboxylase [Campylobacter fetus]|uniref:phosphatidylserine decarboxylase n=1 Tax=Campylobacter fetus TaxID=196 RepID=UPI0013D5F3D0|nr:phosphatidylserine decarboxylase [Campylobacter fetus]